MVLHLRYTGEFVTLRHSSGWAKGEFSSWQKTTGSVSWDGFWQDWAWARLWGFCMPPRAAARHGKTLANSAREGTEYVRVKSQQAAEQVSAMVDKGKEQVSALVDKSKDQVSEYVDRSREVVDRGRAQWEEFVERGKSLVTDQTTRVGAAVEAGRNAYKTTTVEPTEL